MACYFPFRKQNDKGDEKNPYNHFPCGQCPKCIQRRKMQWGFRLEKEEELHTTAFFVTLTYASPPLTPNGFMTLDKGENSDLTKYFKRLRKNHAKIHNTTIKYYAVGEYGGQYHRPHYHAIIFGADAENIVKSWSDYYDRTTEDGRKNGSVYLGDVTGASVNYTVGYIQSKTWRPRHKNDDRIPEYSVMSKGLGKHWITQQIRRAYYHNDDKQFILLKDGYKMAIPRYYKNKIWETDDKSKRQFDILNEHPSFLTHLAENEFIKDRRNIKMSEILEDKIPDNRTTKEIYESRIQSIEMYAQHHKKFRQKL